MGRRGGAYSAITVGSKSFFEFNSFVHQFTECQFWTVSKIDKSIAVWLPFWRGRRDVSAILRTPCTACDGGTRQKKGTAVEVVQLGVRPPFSAGGQCGRTEGSGESLGRWSWVQGAREMLGISWLFGELWVSS